MAIVTEKTNYLWLDVETTGLDPVRNDIVQLACIAVINGKQHNVTFNEYCQPFDWNTVDPEALKINHTSLEQLRAFQKPQRLAANFVAFLKQFGVKFTLAGYNSEFDRNLLSSFFKKNDMDKVFNELFTADIRDTLKRAKSLKKTLNADNLKLGTLCAKFEIPMKAHDALSDISATIKLDKILSEMLGDVDNYEAVEHVVDTSISLREPVQLHLHSKYSHTDSIPGIRDIVEWCLNTGTPGFSVVDHGMAASLFEMIRIPDLIKAINKDNGTSHSVDKIIGIPGAGLHINHNGSLFFLNAWAVSEVGYGNVMKLASVGWKNRVDVQKVEFPALSLEQLFEHKEGIVFGIPGINGPFTKYISEGRFAEIESLFTYLKDNIDIRLELAAIDAFKYYDSEIGFRNYNVKGGNMQKHINALYFTLGAKFGVKCVPVSDSHFINPEDKILQDCVSKNSFHDKRYFMESRHHLVSNEMFAILKSHLGEKFTVDKYLEFVDNTYEIAELAKNIKIKYDYHLPKISIPGDIQAQTNDYNEQLTKLTLRKIQEHGRWINTPEYRERFKKEMDVIKDNKTMNFLPYFLVYEDVCAFARDNGYLQNIARGSAGGSLLSYYLKIIHVDPVAAGLPFERFLSHHRISAGSFPDIDLDIPDKARPDVMRYLQEKYNLGFAQIATFQKMKTKNAIKDAMMALYGRNRNDPEIKDITATIPDSPQGVDEWDFLYGYTDSEGTTHIGEVERNEQLRNFFTHRPDIEDMVKRLLGTIRGWSRHASAFVISSIDLSANRVPTMLMADANIGDVTVTQYDASMVEKSGLVKADILGLKTLSMVSDCVNLIKTNHGVDLLKEEVGVPLVYRLPDEDKGVFNDFAKKDTDSSFQFNTDVIKGSITKFAPTKKEHLSIMTALMRPGAMDAMIEIAHGADGQNVPTDEDKKVVTSISAANFYIGVRMGEYEPFYIHNDLEEILQDTYGVIVYQEQVMSILVKICGYSWEETDAIRSAIAKKKQDVIQKAFERIRSSTLSRGWSKEQADALCQQIQAFSRYSFNKSHSHAYAELGYITMYLKHHYPMEWWASVLNNEDKDEKIRKHIVKLAEKISPPSIKNPKQEWAIDEGKLVAPISVIKGIGPSVVNELVKKGPFTDLKDYIDRVDHSRVNIGAMSAFIKARAADSLMDNSIKNYVDRRKAFMDTYCSMRKSKTAFKEEMYDLNPLKMFLEEKEANAAFSKSLLSVPQIVDTFQAMWPGLRKTGSKVIPLALGDVNEETNEDESTYILPTIKSAEMIIKNRSEKTDFGMICLFQESSFASGVSKKTGKPWKKLSVIVSDGFDTMECVWWDREKPLRWNKNSIVFIMGDLKQGWRTPVSMQLKSIEQVKSIQEV